MTGHGADAVADRLEALAADDAFIPRRQDLMDLAGDMRSDVGRESWEQIDLLQAFAPTSTIHVQGHPRLERVLGLLAAASVFAPVAWTWWSLQQASTAYQDVISSGEGQGESFLQLWVTGFSGRLEGIHQFAGVAAVSVGLILLAVALMVAHRLWATILQRADDAEFAAAETELTSALVAAQRALSHASATDLSTIEAMVRRSVRELRDAHEVTQQTAQKLGDTVVEAQRSLGDAVNGLASAGAMVGTTLAVVEESTERLAQVAASVEKAAVSAVADLSDTVGQAAADYQAANEKAFDSTRQALSGTSATLSAAELRLEDAIAHLGRASADLPQHLQAGVTDSVARATAEMRSISTDIRAIAADIQKSSADIATGVRTTSAELAADIRTNSAEVAKSISRSSAEISELLETVDQSLSGNQSASQAQLSELTQTRAALQEIREQLSRLVASAAIGVPS